MTARTDDTSRASGLRRSARLRQWVAFRANLWAADLGGGSEQRHAEGAWASGEGLTRPGERGAVLGRFVETVFIGIEIDAEADKAELRAGTGIDSGVAAGDGAVLIAIGRGRQRERLPSGLVYRCGRPQPDAAVSTPSNWAA